MTDAPLLVGIDWGSGDEPKGFATILQRDANDVYAVIDEIADVTRAEYEALCEVVGAHKPGQPWVKWRAVREAWAAPPESTPRRPLCGHVAWQSCDKCAPADPPEPKPAPRDLVQVTNDEVNWMTIDRPLPPGVPSVVGLAALRMELGYKYIRIVLAPAHAEHIAAEPLPDGMVPAAPAGWERMRAADWESSCTDCGGPLPDPRRPFPFHSICEKHPTCTCADDEPGHLDPRCPMFVAPAKAVKYCVCLGADCQECRVVRLMDCGVADKMLEAAEDKTTPPKLFPERPPAQPMTYSPPALVGGLITIPKG